MGRPRGIAESKILGKRTDLRILEFIHTHPANDWGGRLTRNVRLEPLSASSYAPAAFDTTNMPAK